MTVMKWLAYMQQPTFVTRTFKIYKLLQVYHVWKYRLSWIPNTDLDSDLNQFA